MKSIFFILLSCFISGCSDADNTFYYDIECDGEPMQIKRFIVDRDRQTVLRQLAWIDKGRVKEHSAYYLQDCEVTDLKNFICGTFPSRQDIMTNGSLLIHEKGREIKNDSCVYKKVFWWYKKIADATIKDSQPLSVQSK